MRILAIDDDPFILKVIDLMLRNEHELITASGAPDGLEVLRGTSIDLILLDWMMPGMDGLSFLAALKSDENLCKVPVIFVSAKADTESMLKTLEAGACGFIKKPFSKKDLIERVHVAQDVERQQ